MSIAISLLRKLDLDQAYRLARTTYNSSPNNHFVVSTYAYSLLLQGQPEQAVRVVNCSKTNFLQIPIVAAYYGIVQARAGHKELAREPLEIAGKAPLLPEEKVGGADDQLLVGNQSGKGRDRLPMASCWSGLGELQTKRADLCSSTGSKL
jgi:hypothetical protein